MSQDRIISLSWEAPSTLLDNQVITYCVDVVNSTSSATLHSECGITAPNFTYPIPRDSDCHAIMFTVTPVNVVGNGTNRTVSYSGIKMRK